MLLIFPLHASLVLIEGDTYYYQISVNDPMPTGLASPTKAMLYAAYNPELHKGLTIEDMGLSGTENYEDFLDKLLENDLSSYENFPSTRLIFYACDGKECPDHSNVIGFCSLLPQKEKGEYYFDHLGVKNTSQKSGIGSRLLKLLSQQVEGIKLLILDTRVFNTISQSFYIKNGFTLIQPHPVPQKEGKYLRYEKRYTS